MKLMVDFFLLGLIVGLHQSASATDTCSVTSNGMVITLTGADKNVELSSEKVRVFEVVDKENPNCDLLVRTKEDSNGEISWVSASLVGDLNGRHKRAYQFDLQSQDVIMRGQGFKKQNSIQNYPHTWTATGITVIEIEGGWILNHNACGYEIKVAEMEDRVLDITVPGRDLLPYAVGPCALSDDCDVDFIGFPSDHDLDFSVFKLIGVCDGRNFYEAISSVVGLVHLFVLQPYNVWFIGANPCENGGWMFSPSALSTPEYAQTWYMALSNGWTEAPPISAQCSASESE